MAWGLIMAEGPGWDKRLGYAAADQKVQGRSGDKP